MAFSILRQIIPSRIWRTASYHWGKELRPLHSGTGQADRQRFANPCPLARPVFSVGHFDQLILGAPFSPHGFPAPFQRRFSALPCGVVAGYPMQTVFRFSRCGAGFGNKKSPHNNLNLTILFGMALVRIRYVAIRKLKTCSGSFGSRAGTLNKYVILNCWNRLPQKSSHVNKKFWKHAIFGIL